MALDGGHSEGEEWTSRCYRERELEEEVADDAFTDNREVSVVTIEVGTR